MSIPACREIRVTFSKKDEGQELVVDRGNVYSVPKLNGRFTTRTTDGPA